jgi:hypothetical protein
MTTTARPIPFAGSMLGESRHICAFFNSHDEEYGVLLPFIKDEFECGDKAVHVVNPDQRRDHATVGRGRDRPRGGPTARAIPDCIGNDLAAQIQAG